MRESEKADRNEQVRQARKNGEPVKRVMEWFGLSRSRVYQICYVERSNELRRQKWARNKRKRTRDAGAEERA